MLRKLLSSPTDILKLNLVIMAVSTASIIVLSLLSISNHKQIQETNQYLEVNANAAEEFATILTDYNNKDREIIMQTLSLRPEDEIGFISFLTELENLSQILSLNLNVRSQASEKTNPNEKNIPYNISFNGTFQDLTDLLKAIENLNYYVETDKISHTRLNEQLEQADEDPSAIKNNTSLDIKLITK